MLSAKALVNIVLLTVFVPRIIRASIASKSVHGSEIRLNFLGAEISILISILGVLCVAMSFKIWMLLTGSCFHLFMQSRPYISFYFLHISSKPLTKLFGFNSTHNLRPRLRSPGFHDVSSQIPFDRPARRSYQYARL